MNNIILLFGGNSCERDISIISAIQLFNVIDAKKYKIYPIYLFNNEMYLINDMNIDTLIDFNVKSAKRVFILDRQLMLKKTLLSYKKVNIDVAILATHGGNGENGELQGYLDIQGIPYTSPGVMASSLLMDKCTSKHLFSALNINVVEGIELRNTDNQNYEDIANTLGMPLIVKPASLGSSIGVAKVTSLDSLSDAVELAFYYDNKVIVEKALEDYKECNIALYRRNGEIVISQIESPNKGSNILDFKDKYMTSGKIDGGYRELPAIINDDIKKNIEEYAVKVYQSLDMKGVVRFDYLVKDDVVYLNEVNTIPGSLAYYLFENLGISYRQLIDNIIEEALLDKENNSNLISYYKSSVLKSAKYASNKLRK